MVSTCKVVKMILLRLSKIYCSSEIRRKTEKAFNKKWDEYKKFSISPKLKREMIKMRNIFSPNSELSSLN